MGASIEPITAYKRIKEILAAQPYVRRFLPVGKNLAMVLNESSAAPGYAYLLGVDFAGYRKMFPDNFRVIEGTYPAPNERALLVPTFARDGFYDFYNIWFLPEGGTVVKENLKKEALADIKSLVISTSAVMMGMTSGINTTNDIRFPVKGIIKYYRNFLF